MVKVRFQKESIVNKKKNMAIDSKYSIITKLYAFSNKLVMINLACTSCTIEQIGIKLIYYVT